VTGEWRISGTIHARRIAASGETVEQYNARAAQGTMLKRLGRAEEVAAAILFLASDDAFYYTSPALCCSWTEV
jgi:NAD(P)-dependent dehydrogenase (short-subunit alcohol dehydrogenase family)